MIVCPVCGKENEDFFRFCLGCGADLESAPRQIEPAPHATEIVPAAGLKAEVEVEAPDDIEATLVEAAPPVDPPRSARSRDATTDEEPWPPADSAWPADDAPAPAAVTSLNTRRSSSTGVHRLAEALAAELGPAEPEADETSTGLGIPNEDGGTGCRVCSATSPPGFAFCANCGASFADLNKTGPRPKAKPDAPRSGVVKGRLVLILEDGSDGPEFPLDAEGTTIGRDAGHITFAEDDFLATRHCEIVFTPKGPEIRPLSTTNGVFLRLQDEVALISGDRFRVGQELLRFDLVSDLVGSDDDRDAAGTQRLGSPLPRDVWGRLLQEIGPGASGASFLLAGDDVFLGRERGDITFPEDGYVSGSHAVVSRRGDADFLKDLGSSNGTYLRLRGNRRLERGDFVLAGQQLFRIDH